MPLALSDVAWQAIMGAVGLICVAAISERSRLMIARETKKQAAEVKQELQVTKAEVKEEFQAATAEQNVKLDEIHELANGAMTAQMKLTAETARDKANSSDATEVDVAFAERSEQLYRDHLERAKQTT